jgi:uncharacterized protein with von Willebrand factor type A (vWA) domain
MAVQETNSPGLAGEVVRFADFLKARGFRVFQSSVHDAVRSLKEIQLSNKQDFLTALRTSMAKTDLEWAQFAALFDEFWGRVEAVADKEGRCPRNQKIKNTVSDADAPQAVHAGKSAEVKNLDKKEWLEGVAYSPVSKIERKDFARFDKADIQTAHLALKKMMQPFRIHVSRRRKRNQRHGYMDFPRIMRKSLKTGGITLELFFKEKKKRLKHLVILADVSGSMDRYARFVMPFILGIRGVGPRAEVYVFSTSLTSITFMLRHLSMDETLVRAAREVPDWSGGTRIGYSLHQFNQGPGRRLLNRRAVVVVLSDGWDLGGKELLRREMEILNGKAHCIIWLNPLAGDPDYEPLSQGMKVALPYVDYFLPADSLESLKRVGVLLSRVMVH